jgi:flagellar biosynthesis protein FlhB
MKKKKISIKDYFVEAFIALIVLSIGVFLMLRFTIKYWLFMFKHNFRQPTEKEMKKKIIKYLFLGLDWWFLLITILIILIILYVI